MAPAFVAHARSRAAFDQLILVSGDLTDAELADLGEPPKMFIAAEDDPAGSDLAAHMAEAAAGTWNALLLVSGKDYGLAMLDGVGTEELIAGVVARLEERR